MPQPMRTWVRASTLTEAGAHLLRRMRAWLPGRAGDGPAPRRQAAAGAADVIRQDERERVLAQARVHDMVSIQMREVMQGNPGNREGLRRQLSEQQALANRRHRGCGCASRSWTSSSPSKSRRWTGTFAKAAAYGNSAAPTDRSSDFTQHRPHRSQHCNSAGKPVLLIGVMSFFADFTY
jgi:hypothetical protein